MTMDNLQVQIDALHKKYFPPDTGHRCYDRETEDALKILSTFGRTEEFCVTLNEDKQDNINIHLCNENRLLVMESAECVIKLLNGLKEVDLRTISAENLEAHLKKVTGSSKEEVKERQIARKFSSPAPNSYVQPLPKIKNIPGPSRRGGRYVQRPGKSGGPPVKAENPETIHPKRFWNGPGMRMLPELYGEALHQHCKFAPENENWAQEAPLKAESPGSNDSSLSKQSKHTAVPVYQAKSVERTALEERERIQRIAQQFQLREYDVENGVSWYTFVRSTDEFKMRIIIVRLNGSWYLWKDNLEQTVLDEIALRSCNLGNWLKDPTGSEGVKAELKKISKKSVRDLFLTSLRNYDKIKEIDTEFGQVLEVLFFNWKNANVRIELP